EGRAAAAPGERPPRRLSREATRELADEEAVRVRVVRVPRPGLPPWLGFGERAGHRVPVPEIVVREPPPDRWDARLMTQDLTHRRAALTRHEPRPPTRRDGITLEV